MVQQPDVKPGRRTRLPAPQRKQQILTAAAELFQQRGYGGVGIDDIGQAIGISGPAVYRHVASKEALVLEIGLSLLDALESGARRITAEHPDPEDALTELVRFTIGEALDHTPALIVLLRHMWGINDALQEQVEQRWTELGAIWAPVVAAVHPDLDIRGPGPLVRAASGLAIGAQRPARVLPRARVVDLLTAGVLRLFDAGIELGPVIPPEPASGHWVRASRREQILDTAVALFRARGYGGVSMADIAEAIDVTSGATYRHFDNKEQILVTAIQRANNHLEAGVNTALREATSAQDALSRIIRFSAEAACDNRDLIAVALTERYHLPEEAKQLRRDQAEVILDEWLLALVELRPDLSQAEARMMAMAVQGLVHEAARSVRLARRPSLPDDLYRLSLAALGVPPA